MSSAAVYALSALGAAIACVSFVLGIRMQRHAFASGTDYPAGARWSLFQEVFFAVCVTAAGTYFATCCFGHWAYRLAAASLFCLFTTGGSQFRYAQQLRELSMDESVRRKLLTGHLPVTAGVFFLTSALVAVLYELLIAER